MKKLFLSLLLVLPAVAAENPASDQQSLTLTIDDVTYPIYLKPVLYHIKHAVKKTHPVTHKDKISGFHYYTSGLPCLAEINKKKLFKVTPHLWVVADGDEHHFHSGFVIYKGQIFSTPKTFFPCSFSQADLEQYLACMLTTADLSVEKEKNVYNDAYSFFELSKKILSLTLTPSAQTERDLAPHLKKFLTPLTVIVEIYPDINHCQIMSIFPQLTQPSTCNITDLAQFKIKVDEHRMKKAPAAKMPELEQAIKNNESVRVVGLLSNGADPNMACASGSLLHLAAMKGNFDIVRHLLDFDADPTKTDTAGNTALHAAVKSDNPLVVLLLAESDIINRANNQELTPLHAACQNLRWEHAAALLNPELNVQDKFGKTPLIYAIAATAKDDQKAEDKKKLINILLSSGANPDVQDADGNTALMHAIMAADSDALTALLNALADQSIANNKKITPLEYARKKTDKTSQLLVKALQEHANDRAQMMRTQRATDLLYAASKNCTRVCRMILASPGVDVNHVDADGFTALSYAIRANNAELVELLLSKGADIFAGSVLSLINTGDCLKDISLVIEKKKKSFETAQRSQSKKQADEVKEVLTAFKSEADGHESLSDATLNGMKKLKLINRSLSDKTGLTPLIYAAKVNKPRIVKQLLASQADPSACMSSGDELKDALFIALENNNQELFLMLLVHAKIDQIERLWSMLHKRLEICQQRQSASSTGNHTQTQLLEMRKLLVKNKAGFALDKLQEAVLNKNTQLVAALLPDLEIHPQIGALLMQQALLASSTEILQLLLAKMPVLAACTFVDGTTPFFQACSLGNLNALKVLNDHGVAWDVRDSMGRNYEHYVKDDAVKRTIADKILAAQKNKSDEMLKQRGYSDLMIAVHHNNLAAIKASNDNVNHSDSTGMTALMLAAKKGSSEAVKALALKSGIDYQLKDLRGCNALDHAVEAKNYSIVKELLDSCPQLLDEMSGTQNCYDMIVSSRDAQLKEIAEKTKNRDVYDFIKRLGSDESVTVDEIDPMLLSKIIEDRQKTLLVCPYLMKLVGLLASKKRLAENFCRALCAQHGDLKIEFGSKHLTALHVACTLEYFDFALHLIDFTPELLFRKNRDTKTPFECARLDFVDRLLNASPGIAKMKDHEGNTLLHCINVVKRLDLVTLLLQYGADSTQLNNNNRSIYQDLDDITMQSLADRIAEVDVFRSSIENSIGKKNDWARKDLQNGFNNKKFVMRTAYSRLQRLAKIKQLLKVDRGVVHQDPTTLELLKALIKEGDLLELRDTDGRDLLQTILSTNNKEALELILSVQPALLHRFIHN